MSYHRLDVKGRPIPNKGRSKREPAKRLVHDKEHYNYEIVIVFPLPGGKRRYVRRRYWLPDDAAAEAKQRELKHQDPAHRLTWYEAHRRWRDDRLSKLSPQHLAAVDGTVAKWIASFGVNATIEGTALPVFVDWVAAQASGTKGRGAQLRHSHLLTIARWCRARGLVADIPFEHAPKPEAKLARRRPATAGEFVAIADLLPPQMYWMWRMLGLTGMRISAACTLLEADIAADAFTVTTKGDRRVEYPVTPEIREVIEGARAWKREKGFSPPTLFCSRRGRPWKHDTFSEQLRKRAKAYTITPHQLRHMAGTMMAEGNLSPDIIQAGLGHEDRSSAETYIDQTKAMRRRALKVVSESLENINKTSTSDPEFSLVRSASTPAVLGEVQTKLMLSCPDCGHNYSIDMDLILKQLAALDDAKSTN